MQILSYNGVTFASLNLGAGVVRGSEPGPDMRALVVERRGYSPLHVGTSRSAKLLEVNFIVKPTFNGENSLLTLLGITDPYDETERVLAVQLNDGTPCQAYAALAGYRFEDTQLYMAFSLADPVWRKPAAVTHGPVTWTGTAPAVLTVPNSGKARANLTVTVRPTALDTAADVFGSRRTFTVTNNSDNPLRRFPYELDMGDTSAWAPTDATKLWLFQDGIAQPRDIINLDDTQSYMWFLINELAPGATATYEIAWDAATDSPTLTGANRPAFDVTWDRRAILVSAPALVTYSGTPFRTDQWRRGRIKILSGTGSGQERRILSNSTSTISLDIDWITIPDATSVSLLTMSHNDRWIYDCAPNERNNSNRGLWYQNRGQSKPSVIMFDVPGGWFRILKNDNNDEKNNSRTFGVDTGGGVDYFNGLDADRTAQGWSSLQESGQADGVAFSSPVEIDGWRFYYQFKNPNAICLAQFGFRESGAEDWEWFLEDSTDHAALTLSAVQDTTFVEDIRHLIATLQPANEEVIPVSWKRDTGSWTGGGLGTIFDDTKEWATDQWVGAKVTITAGTGIRQVRTVTSNTSVSLTITPNWNKQPNDDSRFEVVNKKLVATLRGAYTWEVRLNTSKVTNTALSTTIVPNYALVRSLTLGGGPDGIAPYQQVRISMDGRSVHLAGTEEVRINGETRRAGVYTTASGAFVRDITNAVRVQNIETDNQTYLAPEWMLIGPTPTNPVSNPNFDSSITGWAQFVANTATVTSTPVWDAAIGHLTAGSLKMDITTSAAAAGATVQWATPTAPPYFAVAAGRPITVTAWGRRSTANWRPKLGIAWYDIANVLISTSIAGPVALDYTSATGTFFAIGHTALAPATAVTARVVLVAWEVTGSTTGIVYFDEVIFGTNAIFMTTQGLGITAAVSASLTEGYHG